MSTYESDRSPLGRVITWVIVALVAIAAIRLAFWVVGMALGIGMFLLFTVGPILLVGWLFLKVLRWLSRDRVYGESYDAI